jgi:hypothetical protein
MTQIKEAATTHESKQLLHLVFGGKLTHINQVCFQNPDELDIVGIYPDYESARTAWRGAAQRTVDSAMTRYFIVHLHELMQP